MRKTNVHNIEWDVNDAVRYVRKHITYTKSYTHSDLTCYDLNRALEKGEIKMMCSRIVNDQLITRGEVNPSEWRYRLFVMEDPYGIDVSTLDHRPLPNRAYVGALAAFDPGIYLFRFPVSEVRKLRNLTIGAKKHGLSLEEEIEYRWKNKWRDP